MLPRRYACAINSSLHSDLTSALCRFLSGRYGAMCGYRSSHVPGLIYRTSPLRYRLMIEVERPVFLHNAVCDPAISHARRIACLIVSLNFGMVSSFSAVTHANGHSNSYPRRQAVSILIFAPSRTRPSGSTVQVVTYPGFSLPHSKYLTFICSSLWLLEFNQFFRRTF